MANLFRGLLDRCFVVAGAVLLAQAPNFFHAYTQRLGGHMAELQIQISALRAAAAKSGKGLEEYIHKFAAHPDSDISLHAEFMQAMQTRFSDISSAYMAMLNSTPLSRPLHFLQHFQPDVAKMTVQDLQFGLTFTAESGIYALIGMGVGFLFFTLLKEAFRLPFVVMRRTRQKFAK